MNTKLTLKHLKVWLMTLTLVAASLVTSAGLFVDQASAAAAPNALAAGSTPGTVYAWTKTWAGSVDTMASSTTVDSSGNIYVVGQFAGTVDFDPAGPNASATITSNKNTFDAYLVKFNAAGAFQWVRTWGGAPTGTPTAMWDGRDSASSVALDAAGNVYVAGLFQNTANFGNGNVIVSNAPSGSNNIFLSKFLADGTFQWVRAWGGKSGGEAYSVVVDKTRGYVYVEGDWSTAPDRGSVDFNPTGGHDWHANHGFFDSFLAKYDLGGTFQWARTWGGNQYDDGPGVAVDSAGNLYVAGMYGSTDINFDPAGSATGLGHPASESSSLNVDVFFSKFDANGNFLWVKTWGQAGTEEASGPIAIDSADNVYIGGRFGCTNCRFDPSGPTFSTNGDRDAFVIKYDAGGNYQWARTWGGSGWDSIGGLAFDSANNLYTDGFFVTTVDFNPWGGGDLRNAQGRDIFLNEFDPAGNFKWARTWGGPSDDMGLNLAVDSTGNLFTAGGFGSTVNFNSDGGSDLHTSQFGSGSFLTKFAAATPVVPPPTGGTTIPPAGGSATLSTGIAGTIVFPANAVTSPIVITQGLTNTYSAPAGQATLGSAFYIEAHDGNGAAVTVFQQPYVFTLHYTDASVLGIDEASLKLYFWDMQAKAWQVTASNVDTANNTLTVSLDHLTSFAAMGTSQLTMKVYLPVMIR